MRSFARAALIGALATPVVYLVAILLHLRGIERGAFVVCVALALGFGIQAVIAGAQQAGAQALLHFVASSGSTTPSRPDYSRQQALAVAGRVREALSELEELLQRDPTDAQLALFTADLYATSGDGDERAEQLYRRVCASDATGSDVMYAANRLVDLYLGPLDAPGRAMARLRWLIERFPGSRQAESARVALTNLKRARPW